MATIQVTDEQVETAIRLLRQAGHETEARAVEALLAERRPARRLAPTSAEPEELVPIAEAARLLGTSRKGVLRRIEHGTLVGRLDPKNGHHVVTRRSLDRLLDGLRASEVIARPLGGLAELDRASDSQIAQMFAGSIRERDRIEREEIEQEEREDRERRERERRATG